jgi:hypothetical protein
MTTMMIAKLIGTGVGIGVLTTISENRRKEEKKELQEAMIKVELENIRRKQMVINDLEAIHKKYNIPLK